MKLVVDQVRPAGRRDGDLTLDDVLFTDLYFAIDLDAIVIFFFFSLL